MQVKSHRQETRGWGWGDVLTSAEIQLLNSTAPVDWAVKSICRALPLCSGCIMHIPNSTDISLIDRATQL